MERPVKKPNYSPHTNPRFKGPRQPSRNILNEIYTSGSRRLGKLSSLQLFVLSLLGGAFLCAATLFSTLLLLNTNITGPQNLLGGLGLTLGLLFATISKSALVTEANVYVPANFNQLTITQGALRLFRFWLIAWIGNFIGSLLFAYLISVSQQYSPAFKQILTAVVATKFMHANGYVRSTAELVISGMLANWIIALTALFAFASRNIVNQFVIFFLALAFIFGANLQYYPVNVGYFSLSAFLGNPIGMFNAIFLNLIPVTLGNILGATILVSWPLLYLSRRTKT